MSHKIEVEYALSNILLRGLNKLFLSKGYVFHKLKLIKEILDIEQIKDFLRDYYENSMLDDKEIKLNNKDNTIIIIKNSSNIITISEK